MFDETQSRRLKPAEDRPGHFAIRKGVRCAGVHLIIDPHGAERLDDIDYIDAALLPESFARNVAAHVSSALQVNGVSDGFATKYWTPEVQVAVLRAAALHRRDRSKGKGVRHATARPRDRPDLTRLLPNLPIALGKRGPMSVAKMFLFVSRKDGL
jgi:hypothetical protein